MTSFCHDSHTKKDPMFLDSMDKVTEIDAGNNLIPTSVGFGLFMVNLERV